MSMRTVRVDQEHSFFRTMVLMGGSIALGCGGQSEVDPAGAAPSGGTSSGGSTGVSGSVSAGSLGGGPSPSFGGAAVAGSGVGGAGVAGSMSVVGGAPPSIPPTPGCLPQQWACPPVNDCAADGQGVRLPSACECETHRPLGPSDCEPGERFTCREATEDANGRPLTASVPFECSCLQRTPDCNLACDEAFRDESFMGDIFQTNCYQEEVGIMPTTLCGCTFVFLR
jgi:hypothetical protein